MTLQELANKEDELYSNAMALHHHPQTTGADEKLKGIFDEYKLVHQAYARLAAQDVEALKRGLFLQWYALAEPNYLTGISDLDKEAENKVMDALNRHIDSGHADPELEWMLNYYAHWDWIFETFETYKGFDARIVNDQNDTLPESIDREQMKQRGQMGWYWNSLTQFGSQ